MECFFGTLKTESFYKEGALSVAELATVIDDDIHYYNHERIKKAESCRLQHPA